MQHDTPLGRIFEFCCRNRDAGHRLVSSVVRAFGGRGRAGTELGLCIHFVAGYFGAVGGAGFFQKSVQRDSTGTQPGAIGVEYA